MDDLYQVLYFILNFVKRHSVKELMIILNDGAKKLDEELARAEDDARNVEMQQFYEKYHADKEFDKSMSSEENRTPGYDFALEEQAHQNDDDTPY